MNPWTIIGWTIIALVGGALALVLLWMLVGFVGRVALRRLSLKVPPAVGQRWLAPDPNNDGSAYFVAIERIDDDGRVYLKGGFASYYGPNKKDWAEVMVRQRGYLLEVED